MRSSLLLFVDIQFSQVHFLRLSYFQSIVLIPSHEMKWLYIHEFLVPFPLIDVVVNFRCQLGFMEAHPRTLVRHTSGYI